MKAEIQDNGKWKVGNIEFDSQEAAELFAKSRNEPGQLNPNAPPIDTVQIATWVVALIGSFWVGSSCVGNGGKASKDPALDALFACQQLLKAASRDPSTASVPYARDNNGGAGSEMYFSWSNNSNPVSMVNGFGVKVNAGASCIVDRSSMRITFASLDGKTIR